MTTYQVVAESALAAVPTTAPAPPIVVPAGQASAAAAQAAAATPAADAGANLNHADASATQQEASTAANASTSWQDQLEALIRWCTTNFAWPVSKDLNPDGWPFPPLPFVNGIISFLTQIPGFSPTLANAIAWATFHTLMIFWPIAQQVIQLAVVPALAAIPAAGVAAIGGAAAAVTAVSV